MMDTIYVKPKGVTYRYGTAGFRMNAQDMLPVSFRTGLLAARLADRAKAAVGVMITASHNPIQDNGIKLVPPGGDLPPEKWEAEAETLANQESVDLSPCIDVVVLVARDTRPSGVGLVEAIKAAGRMVNCTVIDLGLCTTPQFHYQVMQYNRKGDLSYEDWLSGAVEKPFDIELVLDCANGVGWNTASRFIQRLIPRITFINCDNVDRLNEKCGADYIKTNKRFDCKGSALHASLDGDADRIVFYYQGNDRFNLLDGDKIAALLALYFSRHNNVRLGVVQTAYANGASTEYIKSLNVPVLCTATGVKHLHRMAHHHFDIGIYFEANGHGTVLFSDAGKTLFPTEYQMTNQCVGDALSDLLLVLHVLREMGMSKEQWQGLYEDRPNCLAKTKAPRYLFETTDAERRLTKPKELQEYIDQIVGSEERAFVRPSGTEDVVRVYAEAKTQERANQIATLIINQINHLI